jgi:hypothetical protein
MTFYIWGFSIIYKILWSYYSTWFHNISSLLHNEKTKVQNWEIKDRRHSQVIWVLSKGFFTVAKGLKHYSLWKSKMIKLNSQKDSSLNILPPLYHLGDRYPKDKLCKGSTNLSIFARNPVLLRLRFLLDLPEIILSYQVCTCLFIERNPRTWQPPHSKFS